MATVTLQAVGKRYGNQAVVQGCSLAIGDGEFVSLLGPSGCGKTATLRMIAGLEQPSEGTIAVGDQLVDDPRRGLHVPPERRRIGMVFQSYAVWPHLTVSDNVAYPLRLQGRPRQEQRAEVARVLQQVQLQDLAGRYPHQLSGGQQQRVALARALIMEPLVLLLDEPLSNLDAKLREEMRFELKALQRRLGMTVVYVTHDQAEALAMSDRVAVMQGGELRQVGTPQQVYSEPQSAFVADFVGSTNLLPGRVADQPGQVLLRSATGPLACRLLPGAEGEVLVAVRPEGVTVGPVGGPIEATVEQVLYLGERVELRLRLGEDRLRAYGDGNKSWTVGEQVGLSFRGAVAFRA